MDDQQNYSPIVQKAAYRFHFVQRWMGAWIKPALLASLDRLGDSQKFVGLEAGTPHQGAIDVPGRE